MRVVHPNDPYRVVFYAPDTNATSLGEAFLDSCPRSIRARLVSFLVEIAKAPPFRFRGGGIWEAMHGEMTGWFEVRVDSGKSHHYRLFCVLDHQAVNYDERLLVVITGRTKKYRTTLTANDYLKIKNLGVAYFSENPRRI